MWHLYSWRVDLNTTVWDCHRWMTTCSSWRNSSRTRFCRANFGLDELDEQRKLYWYTPNPSKPIQTHPNPSKSIQTHPNPSKPIHHNSPCSGLKKIHWVPDLCVLLSWVCPIIRHAPARIEPFLVIEAIRGGEAPRYWWLKEDLGLTKNKIYPLEPSTGSFFSHGFFSLFSWQSLFFFSRAIQ